MISLTVPTLEVVFLLDAFLFASNLFFCCNVSNNSKGAESRKALCWRGQNAVLVRGQSTSRPFSSRQPWHCSKPQLPLLQSKSIRLPIWHPLTPQSILMVSSVMKPRKVHAKLGVCKQAYTYAPFSRQSPHHLSDYDRSLWTKKHLRTTGLMA